MKIKRKHLLYFGPLTAAIEWTGIIVGMQYARSFDLNNALSTLTTAPQPLPLIFATTLILAGLTYSVFCYALKKYSEAIPLLGIISGLALALTGIIAYRGTGVLGDTIHNLMITTALLGYSVVIYQMKNHPTHAVQRISKLAFLIFIFGIISATTAMYSLNRYIAVTQLFILFVIQIWTLAIVWHDRVLE